MIGAAAAVPTFGTRRYLHELVELFHVNIATLPLHNNNNNNKHNQKQFKEKSVLRKRKVLQTHPFQSVVEDRRTWMIATSSLVIVSLLERFATSFVFAHLRLINVYNNLFNRSWG